MLVGEEVVGVLKRECINDSEDGVEVLLDEGHAFLRREVSPDQVDILKHGGPQVVPGSIPLLHDCDFLPKDL